MSGQLIPDLSRAEYDLIPAHNFSTLKWMDRSAAHFDHVKRNGSGDSDAKKLGRAAHMAILEWDRFQKECVTWHGGRRAGKEWDAFKVLHEGKEILLPDEAETCIQMMEAVQAHPVASELLARGSAEVTCLWEKEVVKGLRIPMKARLDWVGPGGIVDLKSTRNASAEAFGRDVWNMKYLAQAALYSDSYYAANDERLPFYFVAVENEAPYCVQVFHVRPEQMARGREEYEAWLAYVAWCQGEGKWPGYGEGIQELCLPKYADLSVTQTEEGGIANVE